MSVVAASRNPFPVEQHNFVTVSAFAPITVSSFLPQSHGSGEEKKASSHNNLTTPIEVTDHTALEAFRKEVQKQFHTPSPLPKSKTQSEPLSCTKKFLLGIFSIIKLSGSMLFSFCHSPQLVSPNCSQWKPRKLTVEQAVAKMCKNMGKAVTEHRTRETGKGLLSAYASVDKAITFHDVTVPLRFKVAAGEARGIRSEMQDAQFYRLIPQGLLAGIFDGHGNGDAVAKYTCQEFKKRFVQMLQNSNRAYPVNIHFIFEKVFDDIEKEVEKHSEWDWQGCTAVVSFIDPYTHLIYVATLGDSEANIYRIIDGERQSIPLSCVRDWKSSKDALRVAIALDDSSIAEDWPLEPDPKLLRYPTGGLNVSRTIGDKGYKSLNTQRAMIHKPKITINMTQPKDIVTLTCDGVKDFLSEERIVREITSYKKSKSPNTTLARHIIERSLESQTCQQMCLQKDPDNTAADLANCGDNVSVIDIDIE